MSADSPTPTRIAEIAHVALHSLWATPASKTPTGTGCAECLPDIRVLLDPLWPTLSTGKPVPSWALRQAAATLHNIWSKVPLPFEAAPGCGDCLEDVEVIVGAVEIAVAPRRAARAARATRRHDTAAR